MEPGDRPKRKPTGAAVLQLELTEAIVDIALDELAAKGFGRFSMEAVAKRAGVGKSALYRRWPSKTALAVSALSQLSVPLAETPDTGSLRGDLRAVLAAVLSWLDDPRFGRILPDMVAEALRNEELAEALTANLGDPRRERGEALIDRAVTRRELPEDVDRELMLDLLAAPIFWRLTVRRLPVAEDFLDSLVDMLIRALGAHEETPHQ
ncbi:TetR/AcrR family transcriptional regulator [Streptomyces sp. KL118A]|uniref:TetR/AcrR family transcriptional regulator n=1 Tax=Streptomyces sp. KL118A TaxID=3045153 RepID=UPI00278C0621|nr:TetR/AcrR family transcriptional regulator [Streptomyces sp. KL118A]